MKVVILDDPTEDTTSAEQPQARPFWRQKEVFASALFLFSDCLKTQAYSTFLNLCMCISLIYKPKV